MVRVTIARYSWRPPREPICWCRGGKVRRQELLGGFEQGLLVVPQDQAVIGALFIEDMVDGFVLGVHAVELDHLALQVQAFNEDSGGGNLVGLFVHCLDAQKLLAGLGDGIDQQHITPADFFAVNDDRIGGRHWPEKFLLPLQHDFLDLIAWHPLEHTLENRLAGNERLSRIRVNPAASRGHG